MERAVRLIKHPSGERKLLIAALISEYLELQPSRVNLSSGHHVGRKYVGIFSSTRLCPLMLFRPDRHECVHLNVRAGSTFQSACSTLGPDRVGSIG